MKALVKLQNGGVVELSSENVRHRIDSSGALSIRDGVGNALGVFADGRWDRVVYDRCELKAEERPRVSLADSRVNPEPTIQNAGDVAVPAGAGAVVAEFYPNSDTPSGFVIVRGFDCVWRTQEGHRIDNSGEYVRKLLNRPATTRHFRVLSRGL